MVEGAEVTKLSFLQMLTDKVNKMDCDGSLYSRLVEARTTSMEKATDEIKTMIKDLVANINAFYTKIDENITNVKEEALRTVSAVKVEALEASNEIILQLEKRNATYDRWRTVMVVLIVFSIGISCLALGMRIEDVLLRAIGALK